MKINYPDFVTVENHIKEVHSEWLEDYKKYTGEFIEELDSDSGRLARRRLFYCFVVFITFFTVLLVRGNVTWGIYIPTVAVAFLVELIGAFILYKNITRPYKDRCAIACDNLRKNVVEPATNFGWSLDSAGFYGHESEKLLQFLKTLKKENIENINVVRNIVNGDYYLKVSERNLVGSYKLAKADWVADNLEESADFRFMETMKLK